MIDLLKDENGSSAAEYGLLLSLISLAIIAALTALGNIVNTRLFGMAASFFPR